MAVCLHTVGCVFPMQEVYKVALAPTNIYVLHVGHRYLAV